MLWLRTVRALVPQNTFTTVFEITVTSPNITRVEFQLENSAFHSIDDLEFDGNPPPPPPPPPVVQILSPASGERDLNQLDITGTVTGDGLLPTVTLTIDSRQLSQINSSAIHVSGRPERIWDDASVCAGDLRSCSVGSSHDHRNCGEHSRAEGHWHERFQQSSGGDSQPLHCRRRRCHLRRLRVWPFPGRCLARLRCTNRERSVRTVQRPLDGCKAIS